MKFDKKQVQTLALQGAEPNAVGAVVFARLLCIRVFTVCACEQVGRVVEPVAHHASQRRVPLMHLAGSRGCC